MARSGAQGAPLEESQIPLQSWGLLGPWRSLLVLQEPFPRVDERRTGACNMFTYSKSVCVGHIESALFLTGWEPEHIGSMHGVATCAPPEHHDVPKYKFALLHTVGSFACKPEVVNRVARASSQVQISHHLYRVI